MLKIGDFSKLSRVSIRMLRHYDEIGLLTPGKVDAFTGYRYYGEEQLPTIYRINAMKEIRSGGDSGNSADLRRPGAAGQLSGRPGGGTTESGR